jgi:hypothetical protein
MESTLETALAEVVASLKNSENFVRLVLSGRRRNMQTPAERIDVKPVLIKGEIKYQVSQSDGRAMTAKNYSPTEFIALNYFLKLIFIFINPFTYNIHFNQQKIISKI